MKGGRSRTNLHKLAQHGRQHSGNKSCVGSDLKVIDGESPSSPVYNDDVLVSLRRVERVQEDVISLLMLVRACVCAVSRARARV